MILGGETGMSSRESSLKRELKSGLTKRSFLALIYAALVMQPAVIWMSLSAPVSLNVTYVTLLLFITIAKLYGQTLTRQEGFIIFSMAGVAASTGPWISMIYQLWFRGSPIAAQYGLANLIPDWVAPPPSSVYAQARSFLTPVWILPLSRWAAAFILQNVASLSTAFIAYDLYVVKEKLPFPMAEISVAGAKTMVEQPKYQTKIFTVTSIIGMAAALIVHASSILTGVRAIPYPWADFTLAVEKFLPGGALGIGTDILFLTVGFVLPAKVPISMLIGSIAVFLIGNPIMVKLGIFEEWIPGMDLTLIWQRSTLYVWQSPIIGFSAAAAIIPVIRHPEYFTTALKSIRNIKERGETRPGTIPLWVAFIIFLVSGSLSVLLVHSLVPEFPVWMLIIITLGWTFIMNLVSTRALGVTGLRLEIPYVWQGMVFASGYTGVDIWFAPVMANANTEGWTQHFKMADLMDTKITSYVKAWIMAISLGLVMSFIYVSAFWSISPIPSSLFPWAQTQWPVQAIRRCLWIASRNPQIAPPGTRILTYNFTWMGAAFIIGLLAYLAISVFHLPLSLIAIAAGLGSPIPTVLATFIGFVIGNLFLKRFLGERWWLKNRALITAGISNGQAIIIAIFAVAQLIKRNMWVTSY